MTSQERNRCPQCNTGFFNAPNDGSPESLLARCQFCNYQRDSVPCTNCDRGFMERSRPSSVSGLDDRDQARFLSDPKHARCSACGYRAGSTGCPNCGRGTLEWKVERKGVDDRAVGRRIGTISDYSVGEWDVRGFVEEYRGCSTCGYVDPAAAAAASRERSWWDIDLRWGCGIVLAIVVALVVIAFGGTCVLSLAS